MDKTNNKLEQYRSFPFLSDLRIYEKSVNEISGITILMADAGEEDIFVSINGNPGFDAIEYTENGISYYKAALTHKNAEVLRKLFPYTAPVAALKSKRTFGMGDRLGTACIGHIRAIEKYDVIPVFAQQSIRELNLTHRTYDDVLDSVTFAVFRENFTRGFIADGDHLKTPEEIEYALKSGFTMITLDCSEYIRNDIENLSDDEVRAEYISDPVIENRYLDKTFNIEGHSLYFDERSLKRMVLIYGRAIEYIRRIYNEYIKPSGVDFEISIDETATPTTPLQHFFVANELTMAGISFATMAPRFCGEFQKGIDYIGDLKQFEEEFDIHAAIARHFGYKISVHSGSDKFSVFPAIGEKTHGVFHLKTAGTSWLEAVKLIAIKHPAFYREIHSYAIEVFNEAIRYYHVTTNLNNIPDINELTDSELPLLFNNNDSRQLIHITYGLILSATNDDGSFRFKNRFYRILRENAEFYAELLEKHLGRHLALLCDSIK